MLKPLSAIIASGYSPAGYAAAGIGDAAVAVFTSKKLFEDPPYVTIPTAALPATGCASDRPTGVSSELLPRRNWAE